MVGVSDRCAAQASPHGPPEAPHVAARPAAEVVLGLGQQIERFSRVATTGSAVMSAKRAQAS